MVAEGPRRRFSFRNAPWRIISALAVVALVAAVCAFPFVSGRATPPKYARQVAIAAVERARAAAAEQWAPYLMDQAETRLRVALAEERRQQLRLFVVRNYGATRASLATVETLAASAADEAQRERTESRDGAAAAVDRAQSSLVEAERLVGDVNMGRTARKHLQSARISVAEAQKFWNAEAYPAARASAERGAQQVQLGLASVGKIAARYADRNQVARWKRWIDETIDWSRDARAPAILVNKERNELVLYVNGKRSRSYRAELGRNNTTDKTHAGDNATPEGRYRIVSKKEVGHSSYHRALLLDYPNEEDRRQFKKLKKAGHLPPGTGPGGMIEIHGEGGRGDDWTRGCVALANPDMDALFQRVGVGTPVTIVGGDGGDGVLTELARRLGSNSDGGLP